MMGLQHAAPAVECYLRAGHLNPDSAEIKLKFLEAKQLWDEHKHSCYNCGVVSEKSLMKCGQCSRVRCAALLPFFGVSRVCLS